MVWVIAIYVTSVQNLAAGTLLPGSRHHIMQEGKETTLTIFSIQGDMFGRANMYPSHPSTIHQRLVHARNNLTYGFPLASHSASWDHYPRFTIRCCVPLHALRKHVGGTSRSHDVPCACSKFSAQRTMSFVVNAGLEGAPSSVKLVRDPAVWLGYEGKWGSSVVAPQLQEWYERAENPVSRTWLQQACRLIPLCKRHLPCAEYSMQMQCSAAQTR